MKKMRSFFLTFLVFKVFLSLYKEMMISKKELINDTPAITLIGMSGVGKTYISQIMAQHGWQYYSCDYEIGTTYLNETIQKTLNIDEQITVDNLGHLSTFVGQVGDEKNGGLSLEEFKRRQKLYYDAECQSVIEATKRIDKVEHLLVDSTGSLCEILDSDIVEALGKKSLFVYLEGNDEDAKELIERAQSSPKPLFFPPQDFEKWLHEFLDGSSVEEMEPDSFSRWVFPILLHSRLPKYKKLADKYGVTIPAARFRDLKSPEEFLSIIGEYLND